MFRQVGNKRSYCKRNANASDWTVSEIKWLLWDDNNIAHIATHHVTPAEAEQTVFGPEMRGPYRDDRNRAERLVFFGYTAGEPPRALVVITDRPTPTGEAYVVSARPANQRERRKYLEES